MMESEENNIKEENKGEGEFGFEKVDGIEIAVVKDMCTNPHLRKGFSEFPLIPTLQHCYYTISLESPKRFPDQYGMVTEVSRYVMV